MLNFRTDRLANWLLYLAVLLGVIGTNAHAETTQLGALRQEIVTATEPSLAEMQCAIRPDLEPRLPFNQRALIANAESRVDNSCPWARRYCITSSAVTLPHALRGRQSPSSLPGTGNLVNTGLHSGLSGR